ncbi:RNA polymerase sigma factor SigF [Oscillatoria salina]|uniref:RNA polymerase sigma factor SigF n=1 Tax=Oscillatoria salina TaxID=331517 RepID=UPI001CCCAD1C|nr:RNA polymerase sigma factor SigF [Oscillatoria salina]MBZ8180088.1 RNA polymerase sigma factor SigF [Oscillatoria salina IIICB1]
MTTKSLSARTMELLIAYSRNPSVKLRNQLVELNTGLVRKVAHQVNHQCAEPYEDLEQVGFIGLIRAIERFNTRSGCAFSSFAMPYIRGEMLHYLRDKGSIMRIPRRWQELHTKGKNLRKELTIALGRMPKDTEIANGLGVSLQEWRECKLALQNRLLLSLDATVGSLPDSTATLEDTLVDPRYHLMQNWQEDRQQLHGAISQLEEKTQAAIEFVFLRDLPRKEAAKRIGISPMTVTRYLHRGIDQLSSLMEPQVA